MPVKEHPSLLRSHIDEISNLRFYPFRSHTVSLVKVRRFGDRLIVGVTATGKIYTNGVSRAGYFMYTDNRMVELLEACITLGVIPKKLVDEHIAKQKADRLASDRHFSAARLLAEARTVGLKLTAPQLKAIEACRLIGKDF